MLGFSSLPDNAPHNAIHRRRDSILDMGLTLTSRGYGFDSDKIP